MAHVDSSTGMMTLLDGAVKLYAPVCKNVKLDEPEGYRMEAAVACSELVPRLPGVGDEMRGRLLSCRAFGSATIARDIVELMDRVKQQGWLATPFDQDNPGHLFLLLQCCTALFGGIAAQVLVASMLQIIRQHAATCAGADPGREYDVLIAVLAAVCRAFGCSARMPILPRYPTNSSSLSSSPNPIAALVDAIVERHGSAARRRRDDLLEALFVWHVPKYVRAKERRYRDYWHPNRLRDRCSVLAALTRK